MIAIKQTTLDTERGFILPTSLVMLVLLTMLSIATYYGTIISQQTSATAQESTQAFYYAETGLSYVAWAIKNDAELDGYEPLIDPVISPAVYVAGTLVEPAGRRMDHLGNVLLQPYVVGDRREWEANRGNPSNLQFIEAIFSGDPTPSVDVYGQGQLGYFDNRDIYSRPVALMKNAAGLSQIYSYGIVQEPLFRDLYAQLGGYIRLDIDTYGQITSSFSPYVQSATVQHAAAAHICKGSKNDKNPTINGFPTIIGDIPCNGAIVWLTAGDPYTDKVLYPIDPYVAAPLLDIYSRNFVLSPTSTATLPKNQTCIKSMKVCGGAQMFPALERICSGIILSGCGSLSMLNTPIDVYSSLGQKTMKDPFPTYYQGLPCDLTQYAQDLNHVACEQPVDVKGKLAGVFPSGLGGTWLKSSQYGMVLYAIGYSGGKARKMIRMMIQL